MGTRQCPACKEEILEADIKCSHCGSDFDDSYNNTESSQSKQKKKSPSKNHWPGIIAADIGFIIAFGGYFSKQYLFCAVGVIILIAGAYFAANSK